MIARGPGGADSRDWAASMVAAMVAREPPTRSALIALSASARLPAQGCDDLWLASRGDHHGVRAIGKP